ncbi:response regulator [Flavobacterium sp. PLA-1-15]|uniref:response regulator n=1 Tax=Flavobacterium sp. PLA-1-15 TaxID=3380533 RepID=UPI003B7AA00D
MPIKILMIDDHPSQIEGYKTILSYNTLGAEIVTTVAYNCESAYGIITIAKDSEYDMVFIDRSLPAFPEKKLKSGEDIALLVRRHWPATKIVFLTSHAEAFLLYNIVKKINPQGLLVKSDFSADELLLAFERIVDGATYYTHTVKEGINELLSKERFLDDLNRQIIILLSQGLRTASIADELHLSKSSVEKRKVQIKDYLCIAKGTDEDIVRESKKLGFI